ncbi:MAG TPA: hypothetical protein VFY41_04190 [Nitrososphaeraceae archaeon]|nr:hypothetical protein [Nitrososphaeraceae archaeon]
MTKNEEEQENILTSEIESWSNLEYTLREEDRISFNKMLMNAEKKNT